MTQHAKSSQSKAIDQQALARFIADETKAFIAARPKGLAQSKTTNNGFMGGVPQHWMLDWPTPFPLYIARAKGIEITDIDGNQLVDLCLGDTGSMFGHAPDCIKTALGEIGETGLTAMLPSMDSVWVGKKLSEVFGPFHWQLALSASDANRFALRAARLATGRQRVLVFDGAYHGAVDETTIELDENGKTIPKPSLWGSAFDPTIDNICVPFNDEAALHTALSAGDIACIIMEPALTNCGIVPPKLGFLEYVLKTAREFGTLVLMDETHTLSSGFGGYCRVNNLSPDIFVAGKAIAGGVPCAVWGIKESVKILLDKARAKLPGGHSGVSTTLGGSLMSIKALRASLSNLMRPEVYKDMEQSAQNLQSELEKLFAEFKLDWSIIRIGARFEIIFSKQVPQNAKQMKSIINHDTEGALHLGLLNRGFLVTPFHNMVLCGPNQSQDLAINFANAMREILLRITKGAS